MICPRNAARFGHTVTEEERKRWCADVKGKVRCEGCEFYEVAKVKAKKEQGRLW